MKYIATDILLLMSVPLWVIIKIQENGFDGMREVLFTYIAFLAPLFFIYILTHVFFPRATSRVSNALFIGSICFYSFSFINDFAPDLRYRWQLGLWCIILLFFVILFDKINKNRSKKKILVVISIAYTTLTPHLLQALPSTGLSTMESGNSIAQKKKSNVYFFILDAYGRSDVIKDMMGYDNSHFINTLKEMDFVVADKSFANYPITTLSQGSMLDMTYPVEAGVDVMNQEENYEKVYKNLRGTHSSAKFFQNLGYNYAHYWPGLSCEYGVDICTTHDYFFNAAVYKFLSFTPLGKLEWLIESRTNDDWLKTTIRKILHVELRPPSNLSDIQTLDRLIANLPSTKPFFIFARIIAPHPGNSYGHNCSYIPSTYTNDLVDYDIEKYISDAKCAQTEILALIKKIMREDTSSPVIVLQSDHGPEIRRQFRKKIAEWDDADIVSRFGTLNAIHMKGDCIHKYDYSTISNVNTLRLITSCMSESAPNFLPDISYFATYRGLPEHGMILPIAKDSVIFKK